jgi:integrase
MAYYKIETIRKKGLVAKIQVHTKDLKSGKDKIVTKRVYNDKKLTEAKFEKYIERLSMTFEEEVITAYQDKTEMVKNKVLTFEDLGKEFLQNIKINLSINYYLRAKEVISKFNAYLTENQLNREPISSIKVRDVQMFLNSYQTYKKHGSGSVKLKRELPITVNWRLLAREKIIDRCLSYEFKRNRRRISKEKALQICKYCNLEYNQYFEEIDGTQQYSVETIKGYRRVLRTIFNEAIRYDWISKNPVCQTKIGTGSSSNTSLRPVHEKEVFSIQETKDFISALDKMDSDLIFKKIVLKFMILTGVRIAEMNGLKWEDIDLNKKVVHIRRSRLHCTEFGTYEKTPKTRTSIRDIPLNDSLINDLIEYQRWFRLADSDFDYNLDKYYLAVNMYREPLATETISRWLRQFEIKNGFKKVSCHGLRHTYCSLLLSQNVPIQTVSKYMGHSDSTITLKVYSHFIPDTQEKVINALNNIV